MASELTAAIEALAAVKPLVLLLEDLHWSDQTTVEFIARLARRPEFARLLVIGTYRPAELFDSGSPLLRVGRELRAHFQAEELELTQLTRDAVGELIARGRTWDNLPRTAASLRQWSGNPLFLIHFLAHLERAGHITSRDGLWYLDLDRHASLIPNTLRMLLEEQLERLDPHVQRLLEIASVVGETFPAALVADAVPQDVTLVERSFEELCRRSPLVIHREAGRLPDGTPSAVYAFVHEFYRQVVYERLPQATLAELHRRIGTRLAATYGPRAPEISSELAMHFDRGREIGRAVEHYRLAADNAIARNADREAQIALSRASALMAEHSSGRDRDEMESGLRSRLAVALDRLGRRISWLGAAVDKERTRLRGAAGDSALVDALIRISAFHSVSGDLAAAREIGDRAAAISLLRGQAVAAAIAQQAYVRLLVGEFADSRGLALEALRVADRGDVGDEDASIRSSIVLAWSAWYLGRYDEVRTAVARLFPKGEVALPGSPSVSTLPLLEWLGTPDPRLEVEASASRATHDSRPLDAVWPAGAIRGWLLTRRDRDVEGVGLLRTAVRELGSSGLDAWLPCALVWLAEGLLITVRFDDALAAAEEGLSTVRRTGARSCDAELYRVRGEAMRGRGSHCSIGATVDRDAAEASFWAAITVARQQEARTLELRSTLALSRLLCDTGRQGEAVRALAPVCAQFAATDDTPDLAEARALLGRLSGRA
jgi:hypothetical protein